MTVTDDVMNNNNNNDDPITAKNSVTEEENKHGGRDRSGTITAPPPPRSLQSHSSISSGFSLDDAQSHTSSVDTSGTEKDEDNTKKNQPPTRVRRQRGLTVTQNSRPLDPQQGNQEEEEDSSSTEDEDEDDNDNEHNNKKEPLNPQQQIKSDNNEELSKQIQDLMVQDRPSLEDDFVQSNDEDEDEDIDDGRSSPKSVHSTVSSSYSIVSSASNYDLLLARLGTPQQSSGATTGRSSSSTSSFDHHFIAPGGSSGSMDQILLEQTDPGHVGEEEIDWGNKKQYLDNELMCTFLSYFIKVPKSNFFIFLV